MRSTLGVFSLRFQSFFCSGHGIITITRTYQVLSKVRFGCFEIEDINHECQ